MDPKLLRTETRIEHEAAENSLSLMSGDLTLSAYAEALACFYRVVAAWDRWSLLNAPATMQHLLVGRQRSSLIEEDLAFLGYPVPQESDLREATEEIQRIFEKLPKSSWPPRILGALYVVEGSTLGGQLIARHVESLFAFKERGAAYFRGYDAQTGQMWKEFLASIEAVPASQSADVIAAARKMFAIFRAAFQNREHHPRT